MKKIIVFIIFLYSCKKDVILEKSPTPSVDVLNKFISSIVKGYPCADTTNYDVFNGIRFVNNNTYGNKPYGALIVNKNDGYPIYDGNESSRFELRLGDCGGGIGYEDCATNRSRSEIREDWVNPSTVLGKTITYTENVFIPSQNNFKPTKDGLLVLSQVHWDGGDGTVGSLTYLVMEQNNTLLIRTHRGFSWDWNRNYTITTSPYDKWINIKYEIKVSNNSDGYIKVFVDGKLLFIESRPTVNNPTTCSVQLKLGIYNTFINNNLPTQYYNQIIYIDGVSKTIN
jgi:hypothetical protein